MKVSLAVPLSLGLLVSSAFIPSHAQLYNDAQTRKIAALITTVACAAQKGLIPRSKMGETMKELFAAEGFSSQRIYSNWDYYYRNAKYHSKKAGYNCLK